MAAGMNLIPSFTATAINAVGASLSEAMALGSLKIWQYTDFYDNPRDDWEVTIKMKVGKSLISAVGRKDTLLDALDEAVITARRLRRAA
jgi:hypothetical protein